MALKSLVLGILVVGTVAESASADSAQQAHCYTYLNNVCLEASEIASQTMTYPVDFSIDEIDLRSKFHLTIYEGIGLAEQDDVKDLSTPVTYDDRAAHVSVVVGNSQAGVYFDVHYAAKGQWGTTQFLGYLKDSTAGGEISRFLSDVHPCTHQTSLSVTCTADRPLERAAKYLAGLVKAPP